MTAAFHPAPFPDADCGKRCEQCVYDDDGVCVCGAVLKPCSARIRNADRAQCWCILPDGHDGDHEGVTPKEIEAVETGAKWRPRWAR